MAVRAHCLMIMHTRNIRIHPHAPTHACMRARAQERTNEHALAVSVALLTWLVPERVRSALLICLYLWRRAPHAEERCTYSWAAMATT